LLFKTDPIKKHIDIIKHSPHHINKKVVEVKKEAFTKEKEDSVGE